MKKPYQIKAQRAVKQFEAMAADGNPAVQMVLPLAEWRDCEPRGEGCLSAAPPARRSVFGCRSIATAVGTGQSGRCEICATTGRVWHAGLRHPGRIAPPRCFW